ncbi:rhomboid family intramembrane serine protease [Flavobacteriaceae bacterium]|nr:rhomboid family intramembrane serine protease [Flavobacteriaceae bacterium]
MNDLISQLKSRFYNGNIIDKLIFINIAIFVFTLLLNTFGWLFFSESNILFSFFALPTDFDSVLLKPWTLISYGFLHSGFIHLIFNLIFLYYIGNLFLEYFIPKKLLSFYLYGTLIGGICFIASYSNFPRLQTQQSSLVGASSAIMALLVGLATYMPNYQLKLRFIGFVKLWVIAFVFLVFDLIQIPNGNAGGHIAHLGGALFGYLAMSTHRSIHFINPFKNILKRSSPLKTSYRAKTKKNSSPKTDSTTQQKVNAILEKISKSGYESLSKAEKEYLFQQGKK